ncbi:DUF4961 domain-containing protein [Mucilaginibacter sp. JRF]|uniref:DUF4961 domain-containing protein n=1 Tax=Mucilaginibacter sp. JRF TaxID=2780088 RepID=UPI0018820B47|nr:DUF4961 domain-containing protein [Mucilaginibacter sp. JRF]MBE9585812.1 DUF4961 domain-containing protein [Mucilaginibacter sp. JRF]
MKKYLQNIRTKLLRYTVLAVFILMLTNCEFLITSIQQPETANAGDVITVTLKAEFNDLAAYSKKIIVGILAPKSWKLGQNTTITYTSSKGNGRLTLIPSTEVAASAKNGENWSTHMKDKMGIGPNYIDDMEWVPFQTVESISVNNGDDIPATFTIKIKVGVDGLNTSARLGYVVCNNTDGLDGGTTNLWPYKFADCLQVVGEGDLIDYCNPSLAVLNPVKALDNDYESITFDNTVVETALKGQNEIYFCGTAHTSDGKDIEVCAQNAASKMTETQPNKFQITFWPRKFFNAAAGQTLTSIDYFFTNKDGTIKVGYGNTDAPFKLNFVCE